MISSFGSGLAVLSHKTPGIRSVTLDSDVPPLEFTSDSACVGLGGDLQASCRTNDFIAF